MPILSLTVGGLIAAIIKAKTSVAAAALMKHDHHPHFPSLLVPANCVSDETAVKHKHRSDLSVLENAKLPMPIADYVVYDVTDVDLAVLTRPSVSDLNIFAPPIPDTGCPSGGDWTSLAWLLNLNEVSGNKEIALRKNGLRTSPKVASVLVLGPGELSGHAPVEGSRSVKMYSYDGRKPRAFTDAALWTTSFGADIEIQFTNRSTGMPIGILKLKNDVNALLLNLPSPSAVSSPGAHITAFRMLPFDDGTTIKEVVENGACGDGGNRLSQVRASSSDRSLTVVVTTTGSDPTELSVSATARFGGCQPVTGSHAHGSDPVHGGLIPLGDSLCMGLVMSVSDL